MNKTTLMIVIVGSILVGCSIYFLERVFTGNQNVGQPAEAKTTSAKSTLPSPTPKPTYPPIDSKTNLYEEAIQLDPPDFSGDYKALKDGVN